MWLATPVLVFVAVMAARGTKAPVASVTVPEMLPEVAWPQHESADEINTAPANTSRICGIARISPVDWTFDLSVWRLLISSSNGPKQ